MEICAYVLMDNHYHLLLKTRRANLSKAMQWFGSTYTRRFNNRHQRSGHLFQGRFKSFIIENDAYLMRLSCYIHRNPVRAGLVKRLADYLWSSYLHYAYDKPAPEWLSTKLILSQFPGKDRHKRYRRKVQQYAKEQERLWEDFRHGLFLGSGKFAKRLRQRYLPESPDREITGQRELAAGSDPEEIAEKAADLLDCDLQEFRQLARLSGPKKEKRDLIIYLVWRTGLLTNEKIGAIFGLSYSSVSHRVQAVKDKMARDTKFKKRWDGLYSQIKV